MKSRHKSQLNGILKPLPHDRESIVKAIKVLGGRSLDLAEALGVSAQQISLWLATDIKRRTTVPAERAVQIELVTKGKVKRQHLRPDLYRKFTREDYGMVAR